MRAKENSLIVFKYGGNAMTDDRLRREMVRAIAQLHMQGHKVIVVHGGGPYIKAALASAQIESVFIDGQRQTSIEALKVVEQTLKGKVNSELVGLFNQHNCKAVGLSGKDGKTVTATKRRHQTLINGKSENVDLGQVGDVAQVDPTLLKLLLQNGYLPVITCIASDSEGNDYNINGDNFAGHIAAALEADAFIVLTDVDGLMRNIDLPESLIAKTSIAGLQTLKSDGIIKGGMIPKTDACCAALEGGAKLACIVNGTKPESIALLFNGSESGTLIEK